MEGLAPAPPATESRGRPLEDWYFQGTRDAHWRNHLLDQLETVPASAFEAVDVSGCMVDADSGKADCPA
jgi:hypothetical protein